MPASLITKRPRPFLGASRGRGEGVSCPAITDSRASTTDVPSNGVTAIISTQGEVRAVGPAPLIIAPGGRPRSGRLDCSPRRCLCRNDPGGAMPEPSLMTVMEVAAALRVSRGTAYTLVASGQITSIRIGRLIRVTPRALEEFIEANRFKPGW